LIRKSGGLHAHQSGNGGEQRNSANVHGFLSTCRPQHEPDLQYTEDNAILGNRVDIQFQADQKPSNRCYSLRTAGYKLDTWPVKEFLCIFSSLA
jgi:hypothetical protein